MQTPFHLFLLLMLLLGLVSGCGKPSEEIIFLDAKNQMALAKADIAALARAPVEGAIEVDALGGALYTKVFGGVDPTNLTLFFNERVHHLVDLDRTRIRVKGSLDKDDWLNDPVDPDATPAPDKSNRVAGVNISTVYWLLALVNGAEVTFVDQDRHFIPVESSRTGVIGLGPAYVEAERNRKGESFQIPVSIRHSILLHEARHSDCTGGIDEDQLEKLRSAKSAAEVEESIMACGHRHTKCKSGEFEGLPACDGEYFGAYSVSAIFLLAECYAMKKNSTDRIEFENMKMQVIDQFSRLDLVQDAEAFLSGKLNVVPDMTSSDFEPRKIR